MRIRAIRFFVAAAFVAAGCLTTGCGGGGSTAAPAGGATADFGGTAFEVDDAQAAKLTRGNLGKIKPGMTLIEVTAILGTGPAPAGAGEDKEYDLTWRHPASKKEVVVKFKGSKVTSATGSGL